MQTFLPDSVFSTCAKALDGKRLNNQINEGLVILRTITGWYERRDRKGWNKGHPAIKMWQGYAVALAEYVFEMIGEYEQRTGNRESVIRRVEKVEEVLIESDQYREWIEQTYPYPEWLGRVDLHLSHRKVLLAKNLEWYSRLWPDLEPAQLDQGKALPYVWPV